MKILKIFIYSAVVLSLSVYFSQNGYSAPGITVSDSVINGADSILTKTDSIYGNAKDSLIEPGDSLLAVQQKLTEGKAVYEAKCQKCHELHSPDEYDISQWGEILPVMKDKAKLTKGEYKLVQGYIAANSKK